VAEVEDIVKEFLLESYENLDQLDRDFVELEKHPSRETLGRIFRVIHTIKGTCGFLGYAKLESITHAGEGLLALLREGRMQINARITDGLLAMVDAVREILACIESTGEDGGGDYSSIIAALGALQEGGENLDAEVSPLPVGQILVAQGRVPAEELERALKRQAGGDERRIGEILVAQGSVTQAEIADALQAQKELKSAVLDSSVRVDLVLLDSLVSLVGELVLCRNQIKQFAMTQQDPTFLAASQSLNLVTRDLQEGVMKTRMQPIAQVWSKLPRLVRDIGASCGKQLQIEMEGLETELDRSVIEAIRDPLMHIVRNAVDHGIERPEVRAGAGKTPEGHLFVRASHESGQVHIEIADDGAGIDQDKVVAKAVQRRLLTSRQAAGMSEKERVNLIFLPGLSTADQITNLSGRGVGMEVVKKSIEKIGGTAEVQSGLGQGTTVRIKIPLTLAIIPALMVTSGCGRYAVPQASLLEIVCLDGKQAHAGIEWVLDVPVYRRRGILLPLVYLNRELEAEKESERACDGEVNILVLQADKQQFGLVVDRIDDAGEIVVKPLGRHLKGIPVFSGATILGDGSVALILNVIGIARGAGVVYPVPEDNRRLLTALPDGGAGEHQALLVVRHAQGRRGALSLSLVTRLEEFSSAAIERSGSRQVVQYRGSIMPLIRLSHVVGERSCAQDDGETRIRVVVCRNKHRCVGLVVDEIIDVVEERIAISRNEETPGIQGSAVIQGYVTDLLDVRAIVESAEPGFFDQPAAA
jgi:two-component system chemotaxis sensor kinase CheA